MKKNYFNLRILFFLFHFWSEISYGVYEKRIRPNLFIYSNFYITKSAIANYKNEHDMQLLLHEEFQNYRYVHWHITHVNFMLKKCRTICVVKSVPFHFLKFSVLLNVLKCKFYTSKNSELSLGRLESIKCFII